MEWYQKLNQYFPEEELKKKQQLIDLLRENPHYQKVENEKYLVFYGEYNDFIFVDYILVDAKARGQGIGSNLLSMLKEKGKNIILEVEPIDKNDPVTVKRDHFYQDNDFKKANHLKYYRDVGETSPELLKMELYYWTPSDEVDEEVIHKQVIRAYEDIHNFHYEEYFDRESPQPDELVQLEKGSADEQIKGDSNSTEY